MHTRFSSYWLFSLSLKKKKNCEVRNWLHFAINQWSHTWGTQSKAAFGPPAQSSLEQITHMFTHARPCEWKTPVEGTCSPALSDGELGFHQSHSELLSITGSSQDTMAVMWYASSFPRVNEHLPPNLLHHELKCMQIKYQHRLGFQDCKHLVTN